MVLVGDSVAEAGSWGRLIARSHIASPAAAGGDADSDRQALVQCRRIISAATRPGSVVAHSADCESRAVQTRRHSLGSNPRMELRSEAELLTRCRRGDAAAWDELFDAHYAAAGRFVFQLGHSFTPEDVEEICQEAFLSVVKNLDSFDGRSRFQTWLFRIAANKAKDHRERQSAAKRGGGMVPLSLQAEDPESGLTHDPPSSAPGPDAALLNAERMAEVGQALEQLGEPCREIIELRYFADLSYEEISVSLALNPKTVSSRLSKCLDQLEGLLRQKISREKSAVFPSNP